MSRKIGNSSINNINNNKTFIHNRKEIQKQAKRHKLHIN